ncbi:Signal peptidase-like protein [Echinicola sp. CAU 1574]|uniref:Signal peptidase-like protein n=1 Tax=Echinicola arenosa TaxID=2774144 RepID=A0ABR9ANI1_9BACT|nr:regulatory iron-sulfur-containing complex subunit RicT [Echinicola arenosa]MBD8490335.1 Signal peptidase-like protein [Echinicola arenosa]
MAGCSSCSTTSGSGGCQNNGTCGTSDCNKMNSFDWLSHMGIPSVDTFDIVEVKFKGGRKDYFRNVNHLKLTTGDPVVVDVPNGHHIGYVSLQGELVRLQMQKRKIKNDDNILKIYRLANQKDLEKWEESKNREIPTLYRTKQIIDEVKLEMKLSDVEYQADSSKATFYYSADDRVDFRELIKILASEFKIRVEMRQISLRQEAGRLGGIGVCGRELCCSTWIHDFKSVSTSAARYQNLSLNPTKLSGQCGRLKCCLNYELDTYMSALEDIPNIEKPLLTEAGQAKLQKTDIFRKLMWFSYNNENNWYSIDCDRVKEIIEMNEEGKKPFSLELNDMMDVEDDKNKSNMDLEMLDKKFQSKNKKRKKRKPKAKAPNQSAGQQQQPKANQPNAPQENQGERQGNTPSRSKNQRRKPSNRKRGEGSPKPANASPQNKPAREPKSTPSKEPNTPQASNQRPKSNKRRNNNPRRKNNRGNQGNNNND